MPQPPSRPPSKAGLLILLPFLSNILQGRHETHPPTCPPPMAPRPVTKTAVVIVTSSVLNNGLYSLTHSTQVGLHTHTYKVQDTIQLPVLSGETTERYICKGGNFRPFIAHQAGHPRQVVSDCTRSSMSITHVKGGGDMNACFIVPFMIFQKPLLIPEAIASSRSHC